MILLNQAFSGFMEIVKRRLKIGKKETDIREEAAIQNAQNPEEISGIGMNRNEINHSGQANQQQINPDHIELDIEGNPKKNSPSGHEVPYKIPSKNFNVEKYVDHEENLD
jgi:hypothetical protein